jgi:hypothetical protein
MFEWQPNQSARIFHLHKPENRCFKLYILPRTQGFLVFRAGLSLLIAVAGAQKVGKWFEFTIIFL